jgi:hypothetical protein
MNLEVTTDFTVLGHAFYGETMSCTDHKQKLVQGKPGELYYDNALINNDFP